MAVDTQKKVVEQARDHLWPHQLAWEEVTERDGLKIFDKAQGSTLWDINGKSYLDGISGLWVVNVGHGRQEIAEVMGEQAKKLAYVSSVQYTSEPTARLADKIAEITPGDLSRVYFCSGGSEAVETAIKIAKQVQAMRGFPRRYKIIARRGSYHGMTHGAMSLTAAREEKFFGPFMYGVSYAPAPNRYRNDFELEGEAGDIMAAKFIEQEIISQGAETVAAVIGEPISSAAGVHVPSPKYWQMLRDICDRHGVLLIADEVINGFGRTGTMFACEQMGITPDIMTVAKGLTSGYVPMGAAIAGPKVFEVFESQKDVPMGHLLTFGGHPVAAVAALKNLEIMEQEGLVKKGAEMGVYLKEQLEELRNHPSVGDVRGIGLLQAIEVVKNKEQKTPFAKNDKFCKALGEKMLAKGLITRAQNVVHFAPPLVVTKEEIDRIVAITDEALTEVESEFASELQG
jgi:adenosylmethionine-8-amino-7-oxononanoate aminotransferase